MPVSPTARRAWSWGGGAVALAALVWTGANAVGLVAHEAETVVSELGEVPYEIVDVRAEREVRVVGVPGGATTITADTTNGLRGPDHGFRLEGRRLVVWGHCPEVLGGRCAIALTVRVPIGVDVHARAEHGEVVVTGMRGAVDAASEHGDVEARDVRGPLVLETEHGDVVAEDVAAATVRGRSEHGEVRLRLLRPPREAVAESEHGDVEVVVPAVAGAYRVETDTDHGSARADVREDPFSPRSVRARTEHGDATVRYP